MLYWVFNTLHNENTWKYWKKITKNYENVPHLEITEVVLVHCNIVSNDYQYNSRVFYTSILDESFGKSFEISPENLIFLKTFNSEFSYIEVWFTDQNSIEIEDKTSSKPVKTEDKINNTLVRN